MKLFLALIVLASQFAFSQIPLPFERKVVNGSVTELPNKRIRVELKLDRSLPRFNSGKIQVGDPKSFTMLRIEPNYQDPFQVFYMIQVKETKADAQNLVDTFKNKTAEISLDSHTPTAFDYDDEGFPPTAYRAKVDKIEPAKGSPWGNYHHGHLYFDRELICSGDGRIVVQIDTKKFIGLNIDGGCQYGKPTKWLKYSIPSSTDIAVIKKGMLVRVVSTDYLPGVPHVGK